MDNRRTAISKPHDKTFRWAFETASPDADDPAMPDTEEQTTLNSEKSTSSDSEYSTISDNGESTSLNMDEEVAGLLFTQWLRTSDGLYWIQGVLGSGKSTFMRYVAEHNKLREHLDVWADGQPVYHASFYFPKVGTHAQQRSIERVYRTLLAHLISGDRHLANVAFPGWGLHDLVEHNLTIGVLRHALRNVLDAYRTTSKFCFFIDGLDEFEETERARRADLARDVLELAT